MSQRSHRTTSMAVIAISSLAVASCSSPTPAESEQPTDLAIGWSQETLTLDPPNESAVAGIAVAHNVYETLVSYDFSTAEISGELAEDYSVTDDGLTYTFELASDATFATGEPVLAEDVIFSFQRVIDWPEAVQGAQVSELNDATMSAVDERTIEIVLEEPSASFLPALSGTAASIVSQTQVVEAAGENVDDQRAWLNLNTAGSGPYQVTDWTPSSYITLGANENWWSGEPEYESVEVRQMEESSQQLASLEQGDIDVALDLLPQQIEGLGDGLETIEGTSLSTFYLAMNLDSEPFDVPEVREAVKYALDYDEIIDGLLNGNAERAGGVVAEGIVGHDPSLAEDYSHDAERATQLLAEAGYPDGFEVDLYYVSGTTVGGVGLPQSTLAEKIQSDLAEIDITVNVIAQDLTTVFSAYQEGEIPALLWFFGSTVPDPDQVVSAHGDWNTQATTRLGFEDEDLTAMITEARQIMDEDARSDAYLEIGQSLSANGPYAFMFRPEVTVAHAEEITGFSWTPIWTFDLS